MDASGALSAKLAQEAASQALSRICQRKNVACESSVYRKARNGVAGRASQAVRCGIEGEKKRRSY